MYYKNIGVAIVVYDVTSAVSNENTVLTESYLILRFNIITKNYDVIRSESLVLVANVPNLQYKSILLFHR